MASKLSKLGFSKLDSIIEEHGEEWLRNKLITRIADGDNPRDIAASIGVHWVAIRDWIDSNCAEDIALAGRARADCLEHQATNAVDMADPDSVAVARLQSDYYLKLASRLDRAKYSEKDVKEQSGGNGLVLPTFQISFISNAPQQITTIQQDDSLIIDVESTQHERITIESA